MPTCHPGPAYGTSEFESGNIAKLVDVLGSHKRKCCLVDRTEALQRYYACEWGGATYCEPGPHLVVSLLLADLLALNPLVNPT